MRHFNHLNEVTISSESVATIGVFDGVHKGHQQLINRLVERAHSSGRQAAVLTFFPHPDKVLQKVEERYYLTTPEQRAELILDLGPDLVITHPFDEKTRRMSAADFVEQLLQQLNIKELWVGSDFALGYQREGTIAYLRAKGEQLGFSVTAIDLIMDEAGLESVHSSHLRAIIRDGDLRTAKTLLGRAYSLAGTVVEGEKRGRTIGVPTANLEVWSEQIIPAHGVYAGTARLGNERFVTAVNIGTRPTFIEDQLSIEAHLLDFDRNIYGETLELSFEQRLRPERQFSGLDDLVAQINRDIAATRDLLASDQRA